MAKPGPKPGSPRRGGRQKGTPNKSTARTRDELWAYADKKGCNPLQFLIDTVADKTQDYLLRVQCAKEIAPYLAAKLRPVDPETGSAEQRIKITVSLSGADD